MKRFLFYSKMKFGFLLALKAVYAAGFVGFALILQWGINSVTAAGATTGDLFYVVGIMVAYVAGFMVIMLLKDKFGTKYINVAVMKLRDMLSGKLLECRYEDFAKNDSSKYLSNMTNDIKTIATNYFTSVLSLPDEFFTFIFAVAAAFYINYVIALVMLGLTLLIFIVPLIFNKPLNKANMELSGAVKDYTHILKETFLGIDVVKNFSAQKRMSEQIHAINERLSKKNAKIDLLNAFAQDVGIFVVVFLQIGSIAAAGYMLIQGVILIGSLIAVVQLGNNLFSPIMQVAGKMALIKGVSELNQTILDIIRVDEDTASEEVSFQDGIHVDGVSYSYGEESEQILKGVSADFEKGKKYLIVGHSGSGKSTLLKLIAKMYNGYEGKISIDGHDYRNISERQLYRYIAVSQQSSYLFDRSIRENIDFNGTKDTEKFLRAVKNAELERFISEQPAGADELVSEEVNQISGGEKLRIGLARALYKDTDILLLDEVTSALDKDTAHKVEQNLLSLKEKTILNISHKIHEDLLPYYDGVCILESGKIVAMMQPDAIVKTEAFRKYSRDGEKAVRTDSATN